MGAVIKQIALYKSLANERQYGLPSVKLSRLDDCKDVKVVQWSGNQAYSHYAGWGAQIILFFAKKLPLMS